MLPANGWWWLYSPVAAQPGQAQTELSWRGRRRLAGSSFCLTPCKASYGPAATLGQVLGCSLALVCSVLSCTQPPRRFCLITGDLHPLTLPSIASSSKPYPMARQGPVRRLEKAPGSENSHRLGVELLSPATSRRLRGPV